MAVGMNQGGATQGRRGNGRRVPHAPPPGLVCNNTGSCQSGGRRRQGPCRPCPAAGVATPPQAGQGVCARLRKESEPAAAPRLGVAGVWQSVVEVGEREVGRLCPFRCGYQLPLPSNQWCPVPAPAQTATAAPVEDEIWQGSKPKQASHRSQLHAPDGRCTGPNATFLRNCMPQTSFSHPPRPR